MSEHSSEFYHLVTESESKILTTHLSRKYYRILGRNKDRLVQELKESKELVYLVRQSTVRELTPEEKEKVKTQSMDLMKSVPSIGIYLLPGGALWLPLVLKLIPDLLPSAFKENEVEEKK
jgi:cytoskeletal protein RodZ